MTKWRYFLVLSLLVGSCKGPAKEGGSTVRTPATVAPSSSSSTATAGSLAVKRGPLVVAVVIDQFAAWLIKDRLPLLPETGGFEKLLQNGTYYEALAYDHAITETAPGHASLFTGKVPRDHGIVANEVLTSDGKTRPIVSDPETQRVGLAGPEQNQTSSSLRALRVPTLADHFREVHPNGYIAALSLKDRGALFGGGHHPNLSIWFDPSVPGFVTSTAIAHSLPSSLRAWLDPKAIEQRTHEPWVLGDPAWVQQHALTPDDQPGEADMEGYGRVFPHIPTVSRRPAVVLRAHPTMDRMLLELALEALDHESQGRPTFLAISLSTNDYVGHNFGPDSWESWDELWHLDQNLGWFFSELERRYGASGYELALSADHGIAPLPEARPGKKTCPAPLTHMEPCLKSRRIPTTQLLISAKQIVKTMFPHEGIIQGFVDPYFYLTDTGKSLDAKQREQLIGALSQKLAKDFSIRTIIDVDALTGNCPPPRDNSVEALVCRASLPGTAGNFYVVLEPGAFFDGGPDKHAGTTHGSPYAYDRFVPLFVHSTAKDAQRGVRITATQSFTLYYQTLNQMIERTVQH